MQRIRKRQSNLLLHVIARHSAQGLRSHLTLLRRNKRGSTQVQNGGASKKAEGGSIAPV